MRRADILRRFITVLLAASTAVCGLLVAGSTPESATTFTYDGPAIARVGAHAIGGAGARAAQLDGALERHAYLPLRLKVRLRPPTPRRVATNSSGNAHGLGVADPPSRVSGPWMEDDLARGAMGKPPKSLGSPELHHADQMPGAGIHEVDPVTHRLPGNHPNMFNQGVTDAMRTSDRQLHWWYRSQEMGGRDVLDSGAFYD